MWGESPNYALSLQNRALFFSESREGGMQEYKWLKLHTKHSAEEYAAGNCNSCPKLYRVKKIHKSSAYGVLEIINLLAYLEASPHCIISS